VGVMEIVNDVKAKLERDVAEGKTFLQEKLPALANLADKAQANPVIDAVLESEHLDPDWFASLADVIRKADTALGVAEDARKTAEAAAAAAVPADPAPADGAPAAEVPAAADAQQPYVVPVG
jgi:hypothetical protein